MTKKLTREKIQQKAESLGVQKNILLLFSVRLGKTKTSLGIARHFGNNHLIVTSETLIIDTIKEEIIKWGFNLDDFTIICYDSLHKYINSEFDCVILDECEHVTPLNANYLKTIKCKRWVGMCAKMSFEKKKLLKEIFPFVQYKVTYNEAIDYGILSKPEFFILNIYLDNCKKNWIYERNLKKYSKNPVITCDYKDRLRCYNKPNNLKIQCTAYEYYSLLNENVDFKKQLYLQSENEAFKNMWLQAGNNRKKWLGNYKTQFAIEIINWMRSRKKRFMVFCTDINQCETVGRGEGVTHSKNKNDEAILKFNNNEVDELYVVDRGKEGISVYGIEEGLIIQTSGSDTANYQKAGRLGISEKPVIYVLCVKYTKDEDYVKKLKEDIDEKYIKEIDYRNFKILNNF